MKDALANEPAYKSVTITQETKATFFPVTEAAESDSSSSAASSEAAASESAASSDASAASDAASDDSNALSTKTVYQFDASGDKLKTSMVSQIEDIKIEYYSDGDDAVCVTDGLVYFGKTEQFDMVCFNGVDAFFAEEIGDLNIVIDCIDTVTQDQQGDVTVYSLNLDTKKYIQSDEILVMMAENGIPVLKATYTIGIDKDGHIASVGSYVEYPDSIAEQLFTFSDYDSTVIGPMPEADRTYEEMESDINRKYDELLSEADVTSEYAEQVDSSASAEVQ